MISHFSKEDTQVAMKLMKRCSAALVTGKHTHVHEHTHDEIPLHTQSWWLQSNRHIIQSAGKDVRERGPLYITDGNVDWCSCFGKESGFSSK